MPLTPITSPPGREPGDTCRQIAAGLDGLSQLGPFPLRLLSLELADYPESDILEAVFAAGGGRMNYTFDCSRPAAEVLQEFQSFAAAQLELHGELEPGAARAAGGAAGD